MAMQSRISVFSDENLAFGGFATADIRGKRAPISVLSEVGANQINSCVVLQPQNIPGFYDRKPLYARGPSKPLKAQSENEEILAKFDPASDYLQCEARASTRPTCSVLEQPKPNVSLIESPMAISPLTDEISKLQTPTRENQNKLLDDRYFTGLYGDTHYNHLRSLEVQLRPRPNYMQRQRDISADMRSVLVDWLVEVNEEYQQSDETLFLTVALIDRFLSLMSVVRSKLQLVGTAAVLVAAKVEEIYPPQLADLVYITDETFTAPQIIRMEALLLKNLEFFIGNAHPLTFIQNFGIMTQITKQVALMAQYICELSLLTVESLVYLPSELAAAGILLGLHHIEGNIDRWTRDIHNFSGIDSVQLQAAVDFLQARLLEASCSPHKAIRNKYAHQKYSSVSLLPVRPTGPHVRWL